MTRTFISSRKAVFSTLVTAVVILVLSPVIWAQDRTIAVFPFEVHGSEEHMHMKQAAADMFSSRLAKETGYSTVSASRIKAADIDPADMDSESAVAAGREIEADAVLYGSLTMLGETWSLDTSLVNVKEERITDSFFRSGASREKLIAGIDEMAKEIKKTLTKDRPDKKEEQPEEQSKPGETEAPYAGFESAEPARGEIPGAWSGRPMDKDFLGIAAGDVTGDGETETVLVDSESVYVYSVSDKNFKLVKKIDAPSNTKNLAADAADINGNQKAEIFVTAKNDRENMLRSFVLEHRDGDFEIILEKSPWFYRTSEGPDKKTVLLGQRHGTKADPFASEIVRLEFENGKYSPAGRVTENDSGINVLGFAPARITDTENGPGAAAFNENDRLIVLDQNGNTRWESRDKYGGTSLFMEGAKQGKGKAPERFYLPGRIVAANFDSDSDGPGSIFVFKNTNPSPISLKRLRVYTSGKLFGLAWNGAGLQEEWKTREHEGHFRDICLADITGDGKKELAAVLIEKQRWTKFSDSRSRILVFPVHDTVTE